MQILFGKRIGKFLLAFILLLAGLSSNAIAQGEARLLPKEFYNNQVVPTPPADHPRLFIRKDDIAVIKKNVESEELKKVWQRMVETSKDEKHLSLEKDAAIDKGNFDPQVIRVAEANALLFVLNNDEKQGMKAIDIMSAVLQNVVFPAKLDVTRKIGETIVVGAMVYDWCYQLMSKQEKVHFIQSFKRLASQMEVGYPPVKQGGVVGHGSEAQLMRDLLAAGIAVYDEDKEIYTVSATRFFKDFVPVRNYWYRSGTHHQGDSYGPYRFQWEMFATWIFDRMGYKNIFVKEQAQIPYRWIYTRRPDGQLLRDGDSFLSAQTKAGTYWAAPFHLMLTANYYKDPYLKYEFIKQDSLSLGRYRIEDIWLILFTDPAVKPAANKTLPLTKYFDDPAATMVARTGWDTGKNSSAVVAEMKIGGMWFANHQHLDAGQFQIYYKGGLAIDAGIYEGTKGAYGSEHDINFHKKSIAHNTMLVHDPAEEYLWRDRKLANDGGQRIPNFGYEPYKAEELFSKGYQVANVLAHQMEAGTSAPAFSYIKGDLTKAYSAKLADYKRSFVFLNLHDTDHPAAIIVFDKITSAKPEFKKTWLLHSVEEPVINGIVTTIRRTENGYSGQLVNTTLLPTPENAIIHKTGGAGNEFSVEGINYEQHVNLDNSSEEAGSWRVDLSPKNAETTNHFLNVLQVADGSKGTMPLTVEMIETPQQFGVNIADRVSLFSKDGNKLKGRLKFTTKGNDNSKIKVLVTDLQEGRWTISGPALKGKTQHVTAAAGTFYFEGTPGDYTLQLR